MGEKAELMKTMQNNLDIQYLHAILKYLFLATLERTSFLTGDADP